jgi:hypothetical protein
VSHSQPVTNEELEYLAAKLTQTRQQQEQEESILRSVETHDLQEILARIDSYLQGLGNSGPVWEQGSCSIRRGISTVQPYYYSLLERRREARQITLISYFKKIPEEPPIYPKTIENEPVEPADPQPGHSYRR